MAAIARPDKRLVSVSKRLIGRSARFEKSEFTTEAQRTRERKIVRSAVLVALIWMPSIQSFSVPMPVTQ